MTTIYHYARCSKSRKGLEILENSDEEFEVVEYMKDQLSFQELTELIGKVGIQPKELVRADEDIWKDNYKDKDLSKADIVKAMVNNPKLIQRPIVVTKYGAVIGRPPQKIKDLLDKPNQDPVLAERLD